MPKNDTAQKRTCTENIIQMSSETAACTQKTKTCYLSDGDELVL